MSGKPECCPALSELNSINKLKWERLKYYLIKGQVKLDSEALLQFLINIYKFIHLFMKYKCLRIN